MLDGQTYPIYDITLRDVVDYIKADLAKREIAFVGYQGSIEPNKAWFSFTFTAREGIVAFWVNQTAEKGIALSYKNEAGRYVAEYYINHIRQDRKASVRDTDIKSVEELFEKEIEVDTTKPERVAKASTSQNAGGSRKGRPVSKRT